MPVQLADCTTDPDRWRRLGEALARRRIGLGYSSQAGFVRATGPGRLGERMIRKIENGERAGYEAKTLIRVEEMYKLGEGAVRRYLAGDDKVLAVAPGAERQPPVSELLARIPPAVLGRAVLHALAEAEQEAADDPGAGRIAAG